MEEIIKKLEEFVEKRNWRQFHSPKNLAVSIAIEAAELLEHFQWHDYGFEEVIANEKKKKEIEQEIADIMIYCLLLLNYMGADIYDVFMQKIKKNEEKYEI